MKKQIQFILTLTILLGGISASAQMTKLFANNRLNADKLYSQMAYSDALEYYIRVHSSDPADVAVLEKIADCYVKLNNPRKAEEWFGKLFEAADSTSTAPLNLFYYAESLKSNGKYEEAHHWFKAYDALGVDDSRTKRKIAAIDNQEGLIANATYYELTRADFNTPESDFSPIFYGKGLVFVSSRRNQVLHSNYSWDNSNYLDAYFVMPSTPYQSESQPVPFDNTINTKMHDGPISFFKNYSKAVFTRNNLLHGKQKRSSDNTSNLQLYFADKLSSTDWGNVQPFEYNDPEYSLGHATVTNDGSLMIFASNMPGSYGSSDLFFSRNIGGGWTVPQNMGDVINTEGDEMFPFVQDSILYFASSGHGGLGGLDLFHIDLRNPTKVTNAGMPFNSSLDDFGYVKRGKDGYISSNRGGNDDIYYIRDTRPDFLMVDGTIMNQWTELPVPFAEVAIGDDLKVIADENGRFLAKIYPDSIYNFSAQLENFVLRESKNASFSIKDNPSVTLWMYPVQAHIVVVDSQTKEILEGAPIKLTDTENNEDIEPYKIEHSVSIYPIKNNTRYKLTGAMDDYFTRHTFETPEDVSEKINWKVPLERIVLNKEIALENIYYDLNKASIRSDAKAELDKLVILLNDNPNINIELGSHTDARGNNAYNMNLSQQRAESVVEYLAANGISPMRMTAKGYGETKLKNECSDGQKCPEWAHQQNRRTEFKVTKFNRSQAGLK